MEEFAGQLMVKAQTAFTDIDEYFDTAGVNQQHNRKKIHG